MSSRSDVLSLATLVATLATTGGLVWVNVVLWRLRRDLRK